MSRNEALLGSALFFLVAPGTIGVLFPWWISRWRFGEDATTGVSVAGAVLMLIGAAALIDCFVRFALAGRGTPSPIAPTQALVVGGLYRRLRNPMYAAVTLLIFGQALLFASAALIAYGIAVWLIVHLFVIFFEEPRLKRDFPEAYAAYLQNVPRWIPRLTPWRGTRD